MLGKTRTLFAFLVFLFLSQNLSAKCLCGTTRKDSNYRKAVLTFEDVLDFVFLHHGYPLLFPTVELYDSKNQRLFAKEGVIKWTRKLESLDSFPDLDISFLDSEGIENIRVTYRTVECSSLLDIPEKVWENKEETSFIFCQDYTAIPRAFLFLRKDFETFYNRSISFCERRILDLKNGKAFFYEEDALDLYDYPYWSRKDFLQVIKRLKDQRKSFFALIDQKEQEAITFCKDSLDLCIKLIFLPPKIKTCKNSLKHLASL